MDLPRKINRAYSARHFFSKSPLKIGKTPKAAVSLDSSVRKIYSNRVEISRRICPKFYP